MQKLLIAFIILLLFKNNSKAAEHYDLIVAKDGTGNFTTLQAAIDAAPSGSTIPFKIFIKNGKYKEKVRIPVNKPFIQLIGESVANTIITYNLAAKDTDAEGRLLGTPGSSTFFVRAADFLAENITFENTFGDGSQAVAASVYGDRSVFVNCRFLGNQDTLLTYKNGGQATRQYYKECYIDGNVDFIFGNSIALFDSCIIYAKAGSKSRNSFITAANTPQGQKYGYIFRDCILPGNLITFYYLGRPWQNSTGIGKISKSHTKVVFINTIMSNSIRPEGWVKWDTATDTSLIYYAEYKSKYFDGTFVDTSKRVEWSYQLTDAEASSYTIANIFSGWIPAYGFKNIYDKEIVVSNFKAFKDKAEIIFNWNISWPLAFVKYELFRSSQPFKKFHKINVVKATDSISINFQLKDDEKLGKNKTYYYYLKASKKGFTPYITDTIKISDLKP